MAVVYRDGATANVACGTAASINIVIPATTQPAT